MEKLNEIISYLIMFSVLILFSYVYMTMEDMSDQLNRIEAQVVQNAS